MARVSFFGGTEKGRPVTTRRRLDQALVDRGLATTRSEARGAIMAGLVLVDGTTVDKPGRPVGDEQDIVLRGPARSFVSRGGDKLAGAHEAFGFAIDGTVALDGGASTGGFTDYLLRHGAARVYAVDVGYGQLAWSLRRDDRVTVLERTNLRHLTADMLPGERPSLVVLDLSFISLSKVWPAVEACAAPVCEVVALVKPQFEAGPERVGKGGVVRRAAVHRAVLAEVVAAAATTTLRPVGLAVSPITGPKGNVEFFLHLQRGFDARPFDVDGAVRTVIDAAHARHGTTGATT